MGEEKEKKKKKKKKTEEKKEPTPPPVVVEEKPKKKKSKKKKRSTGPKYSGPITIFNEKQIAEFKMGFNMMDQDKDGIISKQDLLMVYDVIGCNPDQSELDDMVNEAPNPITFTQMLTLFAERMQGGVDDDQLIIESFTAYADENGACDCATFESVMKDKGDTLTDKECKAIFPELPRKADDSNLVDIPGVISMLVSKKKDDGAESAPEEAPAPPAES